MSQDAKSFLRERGWNWYIKGQDELPPPKPPTHWKYGASVLMIPRITVYHE